MSTYTMTVRLARNLRSNGFLITAYKCYFYLYGYLFDLMNGRIDTASPATNETIGDDGIPRGDGSVAFPCHPGVVRRALTQLGVGEDDVFIDIGCGKGRALVVAAQFPFRKIIGLDFMPSHAKTTSENLAKVGVENFQVLCDNALTTTYPEEITVASFFRPFPEPMILDAIARLGEQTRAVILFGKVALDHVDGYELIYHYRHPVFPGFSYMSFLRSAVASTRDAPGAKPQVQSMAAAGGP